MGHYILSIKQKMAYIITVDLKKSLHIIYLIFMCVNNRYVQSVLHKKIIINYKKMLHYLFPP